MVLYDISFTLLSDFKIQRNCVSTVISGVCVSVQAELEEREERRRLQELREQERKKEEEKERQQEQKEVSAKLNFPECPPGVTKLK